MTAGILDNELLQDYTNVMKERVESFAVPQRHYLPHNLVPLPNQENQWMIATHKHIL